MKRSACILLGVMLLGVGCGPAAESPATPQHSPQATHQTEPVASPTGVPSTPMNSFSPDDPIAQVADLARADLADRLQVDPATIEIVVAEPVTWPDGSLGCPQPGQFYTQALVDGSRVILGIGGRTRIFAYHAGSDGQPFLCPSGDADGGHDFVPPPGLDT